MAKPLRPPAAPAERVAAPTPRRRSFRELRRHYGPRVLFSAAVLLLIALGVWWLLLIGQSIRTQHQMAMQLIDRDVYVASMRLAFHPDQLQVGLVKGDDRLEIAEAGGEVRQPARWIGDGTEVKPGPIDPRRHWLVQPSQQWADQVAARYDRRKGMVVGEGLLLTSLLAMVVAMLYHMIRTETKFRREMQEFLGRATHEMKTPLAGIKAVLQTLQLGRMPAEEQKNLVKLALAEVEREEHLVQNMLLAQRMRLPNQQLAADAVQLQALLERFARHRRETLGAQQVLAIDCPADLEASGDPTAIWTILENLADNAIKYGAKRLTARAALVDGHVKVEFVDDGMGFEPERGRALFESFVASGGPAVGKHGTGLGLSICRALMRGMGGRIEAHSAGPGQGATFTLYFWPWNRAA